MKTKTYFLAVWTVALTLTACGTGQTLVETYYLPGQVDEVNLAVRPNGTFRWRIVGCDFGAIEDGNWVSEGPSAMRLIPAAARTDFFWVKEPTFRHRVTSLSVVKERDDLRIVGSDVEQTWKRGRICARCGTPGFLGPSGLDLCNPEDEP